MRKNNNRIDVNQIKITSLSYIHVQSQVINTLKFHLDAYYNIHLNHDSSDLAFSPVIVF
jgi:hypothetical protein